MLTLTLKKDKETPGTMRFKEESDNHPITIYLTKAQCKELGNPDTLTVTIDKAV